MKRFEHSTIVNMTFTKSDRGFIADVFNRLAKCCRTSRFESTDTSKALHGILPELFVMWDDNIKKGILGLRGAASGRDYDGTCYAEEFLPLMQSMASQLLASYVQQNGGTPQEANAKISSMIGGCTLAKLLDEFNYLKFTKKWTLEDIRGGYRR